MHHLFVFSYIFHLSSNLSLAAGGDAVPIEFKSGRAYKSHKTLDNIMNVADHRIEKAYVLSTGNIEKKRKYYIPTDLPVLSS